ncbi:hypothetical protein FQN49_008052, partial [Arthroderma sp. PD_2]
WNIPPVIADWLWISVQTGEKKPYQPYLIPDKRPISEGGHKPPVSLPGGQQPDNPAPLDHYSSDDEETQNLPQGRDRGHIKTQETEVTDNQPAIALREVSTNLPVKPSRSPSPSKEPVPSIPPISPLPIPQRDPIPKPANNSENKISLNTAISELLKQKRTRTQNSATETEVPVRSQRRRKLFGRANSSCSTLTTDLQRGISRASSIDTLNEDGYGSIVDGLDSPSAKTHSNAPSFISAAPQKRDVSRPEQIEAQQMLQRRLALFQSNSANGEFAEKGAREDEPLPFTQLGYEDPDAVAMREMISNQSQKDNVAEQENGPHGSRVGKKLVIGKIQDGRGGGRRTRSRKSGN